MSTLIKFLMSLSLLSNQLTTAEARAQGNAVNVNEVVRIYSKAQSIGELLRANKEKINDRLYQFLVVKAAKISADKLPLVVLKSEDEIEMSHKGVVVIVKVPNPFQGAILINNREVSFDLLKDPEAFYQSIRKALPRKTAQILFELFFPTAEAKNDLTPVTPVRVQPGQGGINAPQGAVNTGTGIIRPGYSGSSNTTGMPVVPQTPQSKASGGSMMPLVIGLAVIGALMAMMSGKGGSECGNVESRAKKCEELKSKLGSGQNVFNDAQQLATETRGDNGKDKCGENRSKMNDCMTLLRAAAKRAGQGEIGDTEPQNSSPTQGNGRN